MWSWALALTVAAAAPAAPQQMASAGAVERITWLAGDTVAVDSAAGRPSDRVIDWIAARTPGVVHERIVANARRGWLLIERGDNVCLASAVRTAEREALAYFSATLPMPPQQLIVRRDRVDAFRLDAHGHVDLAEVLADPRVQGLLVKGRSYGPALDAMLARRPKQANLRETAAADYGSNVLAMLRKQRVDYTLEYPLLLAAAAPARGEADDLVGLPIRGHSKLVVSGVACPRTPWGRAAIQLIDRVLSTTATAAMLRTHLAAEMTADDLRRYHDALDEFFRRRSRPTVFP